MSQEIKEALGPELGKVITPALWKSIAVYITSSDPAISDNNLIEMFVNNKERIIAVFKAIQDDKSITSKQDAQKNALKDIAKDKFELSEAKENTNDLPRTTRNPHPLQRCMDRFARLLALGTKYSPCIAVAFDPSRPEFFMACNTPAVKSGEEKDDPNETIQALLLSKFEIIREVISRKKPIDPALIDAALKDLTANGNHHIYGAQKIKSKRKYNDSKERLRADLEKLYEFFDRNTAMRDAFLNAKQTIYIPTPNTKGTSEHAEQVLATSRTWEQGSVIGVNYLCCATCDEEIRTKSELQVRGTHGVRFPRVERSVTGRALDDAESAATRSKDLEPSDSESDSEMAATRKKETQKEKYRPVIRVEVPNLPKDDLAPARSDSLSAPVSRDSLSSPASRDSSSFSVRSDSSSSSARSDSSSSSVATPSSFFQPSPIVTPTPTSTMLNSPATRLLDELIVYIHTTKVVNEPQKTESPKHG